MEHGCLALGDSYLITVTYRTAGSETLKLAPSVAKDWTALVRSLQKKHPKLAWFKIPELTKKKQIHLHAIVGGLNEQALADCKADGWGRCAHKRTYDWATAICSKNCLEHELSKLWYQITGDSFIVDVRPVLWARGAASYVSKYLTKDMYDRSELWNRGFKRRWSCSRNWPSPQAMHFAITASSTDWHERQFVYADSPIKDAMRQEVKDTKYSLYSTKVGEPMARKDDKRRKKKTIETLIQKASRH